MSNVILTFETNLENFLETTLSHKRVYRTLARKIKEFINNNSLSVANKKLVFTYDVWREVGSINYVKKNRLEMHYLSKHLIAGKMIAKGSVEFPRSAKAKSKNQLTKCFLNADAREYKATNLLKEKLLEILKSTENHRYEEYLYMFIMLYSYKTFTHHQLSQLRINNLFFINERAFFAYKSKRGSFEILDFSKEISKIFHTYKLKIELELADLGDSPLFQFNHIFSRDLVNYKGFIEKKVKEHDKNLSLDKVRSHNLFKLQMTTSPFMQTLHNWKHYPRQTLEELDYLFPNTIPNHLLLEEQSIVLKERIQIIDDNEIDVDAELRDHLSSSVEIMDFINGFLKIDTNNLSKYRKDLHTVKKSIKKILYETDSQSDRMVLHFLEYEMDRVLNKSISPEYFRSKILILKKYLFDEILYKKNIDHKVLQKINLNIYDSDLEPSSKDKYIGILNSYFVYSYNIQLDRVVMQSVNRQRSLVFNGELEQIVEALIEEDKKVYSVTQNTDINFYRSHKRAVFVILTRYSGLRKNELRSRLLSILPQIVKTTISKGSVINSVSTPNFS